MRPALRLTRRPGGGFRLDGVAAAPIEGIPGEAGWVFTGAGPWRMVWDAGERGWLLTSLSGDQDEVGRTTAQNAEGWLAPSSILLADGRLFRLAMTTASEARVELGRWDVPGAYVIGRAASGGWDLGLTPAGSALAPPLELWILTGVELGRLDGWY